MANQEQQYSFSDSSVEKEGINLDYKRVIFRCLKYWYVLVLFLAFGLTIAFLHNRYSSKVYPVSASIIIKEAKQASGGELLYTNEIIDPYRNYYNETYIIRSYPLVQSVLYDLNFATAFYREGNILTSELYDYPIKAFVLNQDEVKSRTFIFKITNDKQFELSPFENSSAEESATFNFNDTITYQGLEVVFLASGSAVEKDKNTNLIFKYIAPELLTGSYVSKLGANWAEEGSGVMNLSVTGLYPKKETDFLSGLIRRYQQYDLENKNEIGTRAINFINTQLKEISDSLFYVENVLERFKGKVTVTDLGAETTRLYRQMEGDELEETELMVRQNYYQYLIDYIEKNDNPG